MCPLKETHTQTCYAIFPILETIVELQQSSSRTQDFFVFHQRKHFFEIFISNIAKRKCPFLASSQGKRM